MSMQELRSALTAHAIDCKTEYALCEHLSFRLACTAALAILPQNEEELILAASLCRKTGVKSILLGRGSNLFFAETRYEGAVILTDALSCVTREENCLVAACGAPLTALALKASKMGLSGLEFAYGIPGSIGGALKGNAGAFGAEFSDIFIEGEFYDTECCEFITLKRCDLDFSYRSSLLKQRPLVFISGTVRANPSEREKIIEKISYYSTLRRNAHPHEPSLGSFFKKKGDISPALLIDKLRLKGFTVGGAQVSTKHAGFIINKNNATASDVNALADIIEKKVFDAYGVRLERETVFVE